MAHLALQLMVQVLVLVGAGYWVWFACAKPNPQRGLAWLWCGLAGFSLHALGLQALVYLDLPLRRTAPWALAVVAAGALLALIEFVRGRRRLRARTIWDVVLIAAAVAIANGAFVFALWREAPDRFTARQQPDQLNYFTTAQALTDEKFSLDYPDVGARPWLYRTVETRHQRLTECVVLGAIAVEAGTDCQRAWVGVAAGCVALLAAALYGFARGIAGLSAGWSALAAVAGATMPAVAAIFLSGYFSQLATLWTLLALPAMARPAALTRRTRVIGMMAVAGFLAGAYTEFFPIGAAIGAAMLALDRAAWRWRVVEITLVFGGGLLLTTGYLRDLGGFLGTQVAAAAQPEFLSLLAPGAGTWTGWARHFFFGATAWVASAGAMLAVVGVTGLVMARGNRRRWWLGALAAPLAVMIYFVAQPRLPAYAFYKFTAALAPWIVVLVVAGVANVGARGGARGRWATALGGIALLLMTAGSGVCVLADSAANGDPALWVARARVEAAPNETYLIARGTSVTAGWLAFFARKSVVYSDRPSLSDRRAPSESCAFRRIPAGILPVWLDLTREGPVKDFEPSPGLIVLGALENSWADTGPMHILGEATTIVIRRHAPAGAAPRLFELELGVTSLAPGQPMELAFISADKRAAWTIRGPKLLTIPLRLGPGENRCELSCVADGRPAHAPIALLKSVSLNPVGEAP